MEKGIYFEKLHGQRWLRTHGNLFDEHGQNDSGLLVNITRDDLGLTVGHFAKPESTAINPVHDQMMLCQKKLQFWIVHKTLLRVARPLNCELY